MRYDAEWLGQLFDSQLPAAGLHASEALQTLTRSVQAALSGNRHLLLQASGEVGKTFAYLAPLLAHMREHPGPALIATASSALQAQLLERDVPTAARLLALPTSALATYEREHLLCEVRYKAWRAAHASPAGEAAQLAAWAERTPTGARAQAPPVAEALWAQVAWADDAPCGRACRTPATCPAAATRRRMLQAEGLVVTSQRQLVADVAARVAGRATFATPIALVIDEAEALPALARQVLGTRLRIGGFARAMQDALAQAGARAPVDARWMSAVRDVEARLPSLVAWQAGGDRHPLVPDEALAHSVRVVVDSGHALLAQLDRLEARPARQDAAERLAKALPALRTLLAPDRNDLWVEGDAARRRATLLGSAPHDVGTILRERLWSRTGPVILVSGADNPEALWRELGWLTPWRK